MPSPHGDHKSHFKTKTGPAPRRAQRLVIYMVFVKFTNCNLAERAGVKPEVWALRASDAARTWAVVVGRKEGRKNFGRGRNHRPLYVWYSEDPLPSHRLYSEVAVSKKIIYLRQAAAGRVLSYLYLMPIFLRHRQQEECIYYECMNKWIQYSKRLIFQRGAL